MTKAEVEVVVHMTWLEAEALVEKLTDEDEFHPTHPIYAALTTVMGEVRD